MAQQFLLRRDTNAWVFQVWASFIIALWLCGYGIWNMPTALQERVFLATGFFFCLSSSFVLAKCIRDNQHELVDTMVWRIQVWAAFIIAAGLTGWGVSRIDIKDADKAYMVASWLFLVSATFTLAKTIRDNHEADMAEKSIQGESPAMHKKAVISKDE